MKRVIFILVPLLLLLILLTGLFFYGQSEHFSKTVKERISESLDKELQRHSLDLSSFSIEKAALMPLPLQISLKETRIVITKEQKRLQFSAKRIKLSLSLRDLIQKRIHVKTLNIINPIVEGNFLPGLRPKGLKTEDSSSPLPSTFRIDRVLIRNGNLIYTSSHPSGGVNKLKVQGLNAYLNNLSKKVELKAMKIRFMNKRGTVEADLQINTSYNERITIKKAILGFSTIYNSEGTRRDVTTFKGFIKKDNCELSIQSDIGINNLSKLLHILTPEIKPVESKNSERITLSGKVSLPLRGPLNGSLDMKIKGRLLAERIISMVGEKEPVRGDLSFKGTIKGGFLSPLFESNAHLKDGNIYGVSIDSLRTKVRVTKNGIRFYESSVKAFGGRATAELLLPLPKVRWFKLILLAESLDSTALIKLASLHGLEPLEGRVSGMLYNFGRDFKPVMFIHYKTYRTSQVSEPETKKKNALEERLQRIKEIRGIVSNREGLYTLQSMRIGTESGNISFSGIYHGNLLIDGRVERLDIKEIIDDKGIESGFVDGRFSIRGKPSLPVVEGLLNLSLLRYKGFELPSFSAEITYKRGIIGAEIRDEAKEYNAQAIVALKPLFMNLSIELNEASLKRFSYPGLGVGGKVKGQIHVVGKLSSPEIKGGITIEDLLHKGIKIDYLSTDLLYRKKNLTLKGLKLQREGTSLNVKTAHVSLTDSGPFLDIPALTGRIKTEEFIKTPIGFLIDFSGSISGPLRKDKPFTPLEGRYSAKVVVKDKSGSLKLGNVEGQIKKGVLTTRGMGLEEKVSIIGSIDLESLSWNILLKLKKESYEDYLMRYVKDLPPDTLLVLGGEILAKGIAKDIELHSRIDSFRLSMYKRTFTNKGKILIDYQDEHVRFKQFSITSLGTNFDISGWLVPFKTLSLTIEGSSYLSPLSPLIPKVEYLKGMVEFVLEIQGSWDSPAINGGFFIANSSLKIRALPMAIGSVNGYGYVFQNRIILESLTGRFMNGDFSLKGSTDLTLSEVENYQFELSFNQVSMNGPPGTEATLAGTLLGSETAEGLLLTGDIRILHGRFYKNINWKDLLLTKTRVKTPLEQPILNRIILNISVYGEEDIEIKNNLAEAKAKIDLVLSGPVSSLTLSGRIELTEGMVYFRNNQFRIIKATADFVDPESLNPYIDITAVTETKGYKIQLALNGYVDSFVLGLNSEPPLDEVDILSLLTVGTLAGDVKGLEGGLGASEAALLLAGKLQETIEERIRSLTGFDRVEIGSSLSEETGKIGAKITIHKRLLSDRLWVTYTTQMGEPSQIITLEFLLSDKIVIVGERDEMGVGGDIKFRLKFR